MKQNPAWDASINAIMTERGLSRKSAVQFFARQQKQKAKESPAAAVAPENNGQPPAPPAEPVPAAVPVAPPEKPAKANKPPKAAKAPKVDKPKGKPGRKPNVEGFEPAKAVKLYQGGMKVVDIAVELGYKRATGQNRVREALIDAGVYKGRATGK